MVFDLVENEWIKLSGVVKTVTNIVMNEKLPFEMWDSMCSICFFLILKNNVVTPN